MQFTDIKCNVTYDDITALSTIANTLGAGAPLPAGACLAICDWMSILCIDDCDLGLLMIGCLVFGLVSGNEWGGAGGGWWV